MVAWDFIYNVGVRGQLRVCGVWFIPTLDTTDPNIENAARPQRDARHAAHAVCGEHVQGWGVDVMLRLCCTSRPRDSGPASPRNGE